MLGFLIIIIIKNVFEVQHSSLTNYVNYNIICITTNRLCWILRSDESGKKNFRDELRRVNAVQTTAD